MARRDNQAMLDFQEMRRRIAFALREAGRGAQAKVAREAGITEQAVHGWKETGKIAKTYIPALARVTKRRIDYFLDPRIKDAESAASTPVQKEDGEWANVLGYAQAVGMGTGPEADEYAATHRLMFRKDSLTRKRLKADSLRVMYGVGDSMEPTIKEGDAILFDTSDTALKNKGIYVILIPGAGAEEYNVKRYSAKDNGFVADNADGDHNWKTPRPTDGVKVVGRVRWTGGWL